MSDAARIAYEWLYERSLSLDRTEDLAAMLDAHAAEQTATLRAALRDLVGSPTEIDDDRMRYVVMQVDREDLKNALDLLDAPEAAP